MKKILNFLKKTAVTVTVCTWTMTVAATFNVSDPDSLRNALTMAASNGEDDVINIAAGTYNISRTMMYTTEENHSLVVQGGVAESTVLDGGGSVRLMTLSSTQPAAQITVSGLTFRNGRTSGNGGALNVQTVAASITLRENRFVGNAVTGSNSIGGGASLFSETGKVTIIDCLFRGNRSSANVGGLFGSTVSGTIRLIGSRFIANRVNNMRGSTYYGDAGGAQLYSDGTSRFYVLNNTFGSNTAAGGDNPDGGGLMTYQLGAGSSVEIFNNRFEYNRAGLGGAGCFIRFNAGGRADCYDNVFTENQTLVGDGGGFFIYIDGGSLNLIGNRFIGNRANTDGGGAWIEFSSGNVVISDNVFSRNHAGNNGGGLGIATDSASVEISRNIFNADSAGKVGGGLSYASHTRSASVDAFQNTFYADRAEEGGGVYAYFDAVPRHAVWSSNILWHDTPNAYAYSFGSGGKQIPLTYSDVEGGEGAEWFGTGCIASDPLFRDPAHGDFTLRWSHFPKRDTTISPCIDTGDPALPKDPDGTRADMGAQTFNQSPGVLPAIYELLVTD